ncbi:MAG: hypothetical protein LBI42_09015 [Chitinispirillales bacterium]|jgi:signal transduction histidine kinase|nr:hypothetical protein [Chitinispirillales bacterium]
MNLSTNEQNTAGEPCVNQQLLLRKLTSSLVHEMSNPLTAILGFSDAIIDRLRNNEDIAQEELMEYMQIISQETFRCRSIMENFSKALRKEITACHE